MKIKFFVYKNHWKTIGRKNFPEWPMINNVEVLPEVFLRLCCESVK